MCAFLQALLVLCVQRRWWPHLETGHPDDWDTLLFHCSSSAPTSSVSLVFLLVCECPLWVCVIRVRVRWQPASHCPIIPAPLTLCILWCFLLWGREPERNRGKSRAGKEKKWCRGFGESLRAKVAKSTKTLQSQQSCALPHVPMVNSLQGPAYLQSTVQERVCPLDFDVCECDGGHCDFIKVYRMYAIAL